MADQCQGGKGKSGGYFDSHLYKIIIIVIKYVVIINNRQALYSVS